MKLSFFNRVMLLEILPPEGNVITMRLIHDFRLSLSATAEEIVKNNIKENANGSITWDLTMPEKEIEVNPAVKEIIKLQLIKLNQENKLKEQHLEIYDLFVEAKPEVKPETPNDTAN